MWLFFLKFYHDSLFSGNALLNTYSDIDLDLVLVAAFVTSIFGYMPPALPFEALADALSSLGIYNCEFFYFNKNNFTMEYIDS